ncbi:MAG: ATP-binding protein [Ruminococcus sp.]|nr:ATP-binding protein [Ruminococcus sp.]
MTDKIFELYQKRNTVIVFRPIGGDNVINELLRLLDTDVSKTEDFIFQYSNFVTELYINGTSNLSEYILKTVLESDNLYTFLMTEGKTPDSNMNNCLMNELQFFQELSQITPEDFMEELEYDGFMPKWEISDVDIAGSFFERMRFINHYGFGKWTKSNMFILRENEIMPVEHPDKQRLSELYGYERERQAVIKNTLALLDGKPAQNVLLYGDAGTGKSSTIKAIVNEYADKGLRLIEIKKEQLRNIPDITDEISGNPLKFIIFIDDLSFSAGEDGFGALKAMLEGSVSAGSENMAIYATSNRRHLVRERFSDREGDDVHRNDTMQENLSLSARFGLRVNFSRPDKKNYISIANQLAKSDGIDMTEEELSLRAEQFAVSSGNGRSPRTARQFVDMLLSEK